MSSPYESLPDSAFWRSGVQGCTPTDMRGIYTPKFAISATDRIATAGSCFAQHIARHLRRTGFTVTDLEPAPEGMSAADAKAFGYGLYSARYGNIYTARQLHQLVESTIGKFTPEDVVWEKDGRYYDALRPSVEPEGMDSPEEVMAHRAQHVARVKQLTRGTDVFIFTLGLTEAWVHTASGTAYPTAPGTIAGVHDPDTYSFKNFTFAEILRDMRVVLQRLRQFNPGIRFILTVSPVPLTATASGQHVLRATIYSKSVLRVVAETLYQEFDDVDYFPSFEIIMNPAARMGFFEKNLRSVADDGVGSVMGVFLDAFGAAGAEAPPPAPAPVVDDSHDGNAEDDVVCEEMLLEAFAGGKA